MRRAAGWVLKAVVIAGAVAAVALLGLAFVPTMFGYESLIVTSGSMEPKMPVGSVAITRLVDARAIDIGDIVSFRYPGSKHSITHRVIEVKTEDGHPVFTTKGDANPAADTVPVALSGSIHRVVRVVPYAGRLVRLARSPVGGVALFLVPIVGLLADRRRSAKGPRPEPAGARAPVHTAASQASAITLPASTASPVAAALIGAIGALRAMPIAGPVSPPGREAAIESFLARVLVQEGGRRAAVTARKVRARVAG